MNVPLSRVRITHNFRVLSLPLVNGFLEVKLLQKYYPQATGLTFTQNGEMVAEDFYEGGEYIIIRPDVDVYHLFVPEGTKTLTNFSPFIFRIINKCFFFLYNLLRSWIQHNRRNQSSIRKYPMYKKFKEQTLEGDSALWQCFQRKNSQKNKGAQFAKSRATSYFDVQKS